jgi:hypothetical protein
MEAFIPYAIHTLAAIAGVLAVSRLLPGQRTAREWAELAEE